jgi:hypothetical protein
MYIKQDGVMKQVMKRVALLLAFSVATATAHAAALGMEEVRELGRLNGLALACSQGDNISRIKVVMITHAPKSRQYGAGFEEATQEAFLLRSGEPGACIDAPLIALQVEEQAARLGALFPAAAMPQ